MSAFYIHYFDPSVFAKMITEHIDDFQNGAAIVSILKFFPNMLCFLFIWFYSLYPIGYYRTHFNSKFSFAG